MLIIYTSLNAIESGELLKYNQYMKTNLQIKYMEVNDNGTKILLQESERQKNKGQM